MKKPRFLTVLNSVVVTAINSAIGRFEPLALGEGEVQKRYRLSPYGVFPAELADGRVIQQVVDREAAELMIANNDKFAAKLESFFRGVPIYEGHADDPDWVKNNPGHKTSAVGRIKKIEAAEDGIYIESVFNSDGVAMLSGEAPKYSGHSPRWRMVEIPGRKDHYRPALLWSDALTNYPNIPGNTIALNALDPSEIDPSPTAEDTAEPENENETMKLDPELLKRLGFAPDATPTDAEISAAIIKALDKKAEEDAKTANSEAVTAANSRATALETELASVRKAATDIVLKDALATGRITEADKPKWETALNTSFASEADKLSKLMPTINVNGAPDLSGRRGDGVDVANTSQTLTDAVRDFAKEKGIDVSNQAGWDRAWAECKEAKPDLFKR